MGLNRCFRRRKSLFLSFRFIIFLLLMFVRRLPIEHRCRADIYAVHLAERLVLRHLLLHHLPLRFIFRAFALAHAVPPLAAVRVDRFCLRV